MPPSPSPAPELPTLSIGESAALAGVRSPAIRSYEIVGLRTRFHGVGAEVPRAERWRMLARWTIADRYALVRGGTAP